MNAELDAKAAEWVENLEAEAVAREDGDAPLGWVFSPDAYDVTVAPGKNVQAA